jgi:hypothetical protein
MWRATAWARRERAGHVALASLGLNIPPGAAGVAMARVRAGLAGVIMGGRCTRASGTKDVLHDRHR